MCGIAGFVDLKRREPADPGVLDRMLDTLTHRGPDGAGAMVDGAIALGMRRLSIIDPVGSAQPLYNEDETLMLVGNGEIFNYVELRETLRARGHFFGTNGDLEVILHLFEEYGLRFTDHLNGQFSLAILDRRDGSLHLLRDGFGITPLYHATFGDTFVFGSEIKSILCHPAARKAIDLIGLDQVLCFPGLVSPRTMFRNVCSLRPGHCLTVTVNGVHEHRFWDLDYPADAAPAGNIDKADAVAQFLELFDAAVRRRLRADVPVGVYLSGGLDSSFLGASVRAVAPDHDLTTFSITFPEDRAINERRYQLVMAQSLGSRHVEIPFESGQIGALLHKMVWHSECPVTETYNVCSMVMSAAARARDVPVILGGEGADELLGGYPGYRFDAFVSGRGRESLDADEAATRQRLWGAESIRYERRYSEYRSLRRRFLSRDVEAELASQDCLSEPPVDPSQLAGRHAFHQRSYLDVKLRLGEHLLGDHGDRMNMASSVEGRFPFLDRDLVDFVRALPPALKLNGMQEKYILKRAATERVPDAIVKREKFGFRAPGSDYLLSLNDEWIRDALSPDRIAREGFFDPEAMTREIARRKARRTGANPHAEDDVPLMCLTFSILLEQFGIAGL